MARLQELCRQGDVATVRQRLEAAVREISRYRGTMNEHERLTVEAYDYAKLGDLDEVAFRIRLRDEPKYHDLDVCEAKYREAMAEKKKASA